MFERFTTAARNVVVSAQGQAHDLRHPYIGTQHLLLALMDADADGVAGRALHGAGVRADAVRDEVVRRFDANKVGLGERDAEALQAIGIDLDAVRAKVEETFGPGALDEPPIDCDEPKGTGLVSRLRGRKRPQRRPSTGHLPFAPRSKKVLELSLREAIHLHHGYIGPEHILLGLLREGEGLAVQILVEGGVDLDDLRRRTLAGIDQAA
jgi:ATP-dependent Clp protease ATP-binding subunit ClpA